jgi:molybdopterin synthase catalytic subunit
MKERKPKAIFTEGAITADFIARSIAGHSSRHDIGAHAIFLGQVRADVKPEGTVAAIEYSAYTEMAEAEMHRIREEVFAEFPLTCMHVHHSLGRVQAGEICLFVFTSSERRKAAQDACAVLVERIKAELPVWGKEIFADENYIWKENT